MNRADIIPLLDLTSLTGTETEDEIEELCRRGLAFGVAAACVYGTWVERAAASGIRVATVANFPDPDPDPERAKRESAQAMANGADEVDVVIPFEHGPREWAAVVEAARSEAAVLKVILESGVLGPERTRQAAQIALDHGADFLKTSTGKRQPGATPEAARTMIAAGGGFKASGGVRTYEQARMYTDLFTEIRGQPPAAETFRIGASSLLDELTK